MNTATIIKEKKGTVVDVRTTEEFNVANAKGSVNIPLQELERRIDELKILAKPLVLCCASGGRSARATQYLMQQGIECCNGGSWLDVKYYQSENQ